jgi:hypothetical protein
MQHYVGLVAHPIRRQRATSLRGVHARYGSIRTPRKLRGILRGASQVLISKWRGDMPFGEPFG